jgi:hypothetical protein
MQIHIIESSGGEMSFWVGVITGLVLYGVFCLLVYISYDMLKYEKPKAINYPPTPVAILFAPVTAVVLALVSITYAIKSTILWVLSLFQD